MASPGARGYHLSAPLVTDAYIVVDETTLLATGFVFKLHSFFFFSFQPESDQSLALLEDNPSSLFSLPGLVIKLLTIK